LKFLGSICEARGKDIGKEVNESKDKRREGHEVGGALKLKLGVQEATKNRGYDASYRIAYVKQV
jgi:hypothetical protein